MVLGMQPGSDLIAPTGLSPSMAGRSSPLRLLKSDPIWLHPKLHIRIQLPGCVRFELCRFPSPVLTASRLVSLPARTKMFQFRAFAFGIPFMVSRIPGVYPWREVPFGDGRI